MNVTGNQIIVCHVIACCLLRNPLNLVGTGLLPRFFFLCFVRALVFISPLKIFHQAGHVNRSWARVDYSKPFMHSIFIDILQNGC